MDADCQSMDKLASQPSKIATNLYLGCVNSALHRSFLQNVGIRGIVNVTVDESNSYPESFDYLRVSIKDHSIERVRPFFQPVFDFIQHHRNSGHGVLVHCHMGISRSATFMIAYLMMAEHRTLGEAFRHVQKIRPQIEPNPGFITELRELERALFGQVFTTELLTHLDCGPGIDSKDILLNILADMTAGAAANAPVNSIRSMQNQLLQFAKDIEQDKITDIVCGGVCKCFEMFGGSTRRDKKARMGLKQGLLALCTLKDIDLKTSLNNMTKSEAWQDLCIDVPLANRWLVDLKG